MIDLVTLDQVPFFLAALVEVSLLFLLVATEAHWMKSARVLQDVASVAAVLSVAAFLILLGRAWGWLECSRSEAKAPRTMPQSLHQGQYEHFFFRP